MKPLRRRELTYALAREEDLDRILDFCRDRLFGTEIWSSVKLCGADTDIGSLWTGTDRRGRLQTVVYDNGAYLTRLTKRGGCAAKPPKDDPGFDLFAPPQRKNRLRLMVYRGKKLPFPDGAEELRGTALLDMYKAVKETETLNDKAQRRYVFRARAVNAGLSEVFALCEDGQIAATAGINAKNERYALIGDVFTVYQYRYQGYATRLTKACVARAQKQGLTPVLYCEKNMRKFYRKLGFVGVIRNAEFGMRNYVNHPACSRI